jgi:hypothetical protein
MRKVPAQYLLDQIAATNPYRKQSQNKPQEFQIYQAGFLAAYLASLMQEDPWILKRFEQHIEKLKNRKG